MTLHDLICQESSQYHIGEVFLASTESRRLELRHTGFGEHPVLNRGADRDSVVSLYSVELLDVNVEVSDSRRRSTEMLYFP